MQTICSAGIPLNHSNIWNDMKKLCDEANVARNKVFPHNLRHTFATRLCEDNVNMKVIQDVLGHSVYRTTMDLYAEVTKDHKQKEFSSLDVKMML